MIDAITFTPTTQLQAEILGEIKAAARHGTLLACKEKFGAGPNYTVTLDEMQFIELIITGLLDTPKGRGQLKSLLHKSNALYDRRAAPHN